MLKEKDCYRRYVRFNADIFFLSLIIWFYRRCTVRYQRYFPFTGVSCCCATNVDEKKPNDGIVRLLCGLLHAAVFNTFHSVLVIKLTVFIFFALVCFDLPLLCVFNEFFIVLFVFHKDHPFGEVSPKPAIVCAICCPFCMQAPMPTPK